MSFERAIGGALVGVCCLAGCDSSPPTPAEKKQQAQQDLDSAAWTAAENYVKQFLEYPLDASFPWTPATVQRNPDTDVYSVSSTVTAKNAFGAELTHEWMVLLKHTDDGQWELLACAIGNESVYRSPALDDLLSGAAAGAEVDEEEETILEDIRAANPPDPEPELIIKVHPPELDIPRWEPPPEPEPEWRTWTSADGQYTVEAEFVSFAMGDVKLRNKDGKTITLRMKKLSWTDQEWIRKRGRR